MKKLMACCGLFLLGMFARADGSSWTVSLNPGYAIPQGDAGDTLKSAFDIDGSGEYALEEFLSIGMEAGYSNHKLEGTLSGGTFNGVPFSSDVHASILHVTPYVKFGHTVVFPSFKVRPYLFAGFGYYHLSQTAGTLNFLGVAIPTDSASDDFSGMNLGGGLDVPISDHIAIGALVHYHQIFEPGSDDKLIVPSARIAYTF